jgi:amino acid transporter
MTNGMPNDPDDQRNPDKSLSSPLPETPSVPTETAEMPPSAPASSSGSGSVDGFQPTSNNRANAQESDGSVASSVNMEDHGNRTGKGNRSSALEERSLVEGAKPGSTYLRVRLPRQDEFRRRQADVLVATERTLEPQSRLGKVYAGMKRLVLGPRLATAQQATERLTKVKALAVLSSDAISSVAYGPEAALGILIVAGAGALRANLPIAGLIALLMIVVGFSYRQTIHAYPHGGGSYIVARENLGTIPGLIAAAALLIDYVLNVSVSVAAGVNAIISAIPVLSHLAVWMGVGFIALIMLVNLRGIRESGSIFAAPTYLFIGALLLMIVAGLLQAATSPGGLLGAVTPTRTPHELGWAPEQLSLILLLTAFASGCSAMTGVEAIANGVPAFKPPEPENAARTLQWTITVLVGLFLGVTYLTWRFGIEPYQSGSPTVLAQIGTAVFTGPFAWLFYVLQAATLLMLVLASNTSFADFPRLASILARDNFLPHQFSFRGDRLAFTTGIVVLSLLSALLLVVFGGNVDGLINLFALGVFTAFTASQSGMVVHWWRLRRTDQRGGWRRSLIINAIGAVTTGIVAAIIIFTKFDRGAWIVVLLVPIFVLLFLGIARHYRRSQQQLRPLTPLRSDELHNIALVPLDRVTNVALQSLAYARSLTPNVLAVHVVIDPVEESSIRADWQQLVETHQADWQRQAHKWEALATQLTRDDPEGAQAARERAAAIRKGPELIFLESPYRSLAAPLVAYINAVRDANPQATVTVVLPEFIPAHWWERLLHNQTALRLKLALYTDPGVVVTNVPYQLQD